MAREIGIKSFELRNTSEIVDRKNVWFESGVRLAMGLEWTINSDNWTSRGGSGNGDSILSNGGLKTDGNLIFMCGYGDGIGIRRINDDGTFTTVYNNASPLNSYGYYTSCAVDQKRKHWYFGNWVYDNIGRIDYSDTSSLSVETLTTAGNDLPEDEVGYTYISGLEVVGDYLYIFPDGSSTTQVMRWLIPSESNESLDVVNTIYNAIYGHTWYDAEHDRVYYYARADGMLRVVTNPQATASYAEAPVGTVTASAFQIRTDSVLGGNDVYGFVCVPDNDNPNLMWISSNYGRYCQVDITRCLTGENAHPLFVKGNTRYNDQNDKKPLVMHESEGVLCRKHPVWGGDMPILKCNSGWGGYNWHWLDIENGYLVGMSLINSYRLRRTGNTSYTSSQSNTQLEFTYVNVPDPNFAMVSSSEGTKYWVIGGYGDDGNALISYAVDDFPNLLELHTSGYLTFGDYQLNDQRDITSIKIENMREGVFEPSNTRLNVSVSNNGGKTWESYGWKKEEDHSFRSVGNTVQVKFILRGNGQRGAWMTSFVGITVTVQGTDIASRESTIEPTTKIQGI